MFAPAKGECCMLAGSAASRKLDLCVSLIGEVS